LWREGVESIGDCSADSAGGSSAQKVFELGEDLLDWDGFALVVAEIV